VDNDLLFALLVVVSDTILGRPRRKMLVTLPQQEHSAVVEERVDPASFRSVMALQSLKNSHSSLELEVTGTREKKVSTRRYKG
jgi:hypothetical protein